MVQAHMWYYPLINKASSGSQVEAVLDLPSGFNDMDKEDYKACKL